jgi:hypothetical protein
MESCHAPDLSQPIGIQLNLGQSGQIAPVAFWATKVSDARNPFKKPSMNSFLESMKQLSRHMAFGLLNQRPQ